MTGTVREYLYAGGEAPTAMRARQADGTYKNFFFVTNTHGDVVALTDKDGNIVNRYAYGPWGEATRVSEQVHQPFRYAGYRYEDGFDLYYLRARWMDPGTGRFLSRDPMAGALQNPRALNAYIYAFDSPATETDPGGYDPDRRKVIVFFGGMNSFVDNDVRFRRFVKDHFPGWDELVMMYELGWRDLWGGGDHVRKASTQLRNRVGGRQLFSIGHSEGGDILFRSIEETRMPMSAVATIGTPIKEVSANARYRVGYWLDVCFVDDSICYYQPLGYYGYADETLYVGGGGHGLDTYLSHPEVIDAIQRVFHRQAQRAPA